MTIAQWVSDGYAQRLKKSPIRVDEEHGFYGIQLGQTLEIESFRGFEFRWKKYKPKLLWHRQQKALLFLDIPNRSLGPKDVKGKFDLEGLKGKDGTLYKEFHGKAPKQLTTYGFKTKGNQWITFGTVVRIDYFSTKRGKRDSYTHKHASGVRLYRLGEDTGPTLWVIKGGSLTVTGRGIIH